MRFPIAVDSILRDYPRIYFACHRRHTRDPLTDDLVSEKQSQILDHLDEVQSLSLGTLAEHMGVTAGTMSIGIDRLVKRGYVTRVPDAVDRRRVHLRLTAAGARVCEAHSVLDPELIDAMVASLAPDDRDRALAGLTLLSKAATESHRSRPRGGLEHSA